MFSKDHYKNTVLQTPFHPRTSALNVLNEWHRWKDYTVSDQYFDSGLEYFAVRNTTGVFDLTPMTKNRIEGPDALEFLNRFSTRNVSKIRPGRVGYTVWCDGEGQVIDDGTIFHLEEGVYRLCSQERQFDWLLTSAIGFDVEITEETHQVAGLAAQGPTSCAVLKSMGLEGIEDLKPYGLIHFPYEGTQLMVSRTGFTGDLGYELWIEPERALALWDDLFAAGQVHGIKPIGTHALELARIEAGFIQAGSDFMPADEAIRPGRTRSPYELGLGWLVDLDKPNFTGRAALVTEKAKGSRYNFVKLNVEGNKPANDSFIYNNKKKVVGIVHSAAWTPTLKANIALASLQTPWGRPEDKLFAEIYYQRELAWSRIMAPCSVVTGPLFNPDRRWATPAPDC